MNFHLTVEGAKKALASGPDPFVVMMKNKGMQVEYFAPEEMDTQTPHRQDELYVIISGTAEFLRENEIVNCKTGDILFVPAGMVHRFQNFSNDFATWVIFY